MTTFYASAKAALLRGEVDFRTDIKAVMVEGYTPAPTDEFRSDITGEVGTPVALTTTVTATGEVTVPTITFVSPPAGHLIDGIVVYVDTGSSATDRLLGHINRSVGALPILKNTDDGDVELTFSPLVRI